MTSRLLPLAGPALLFLIWQAISWSGLVSPVLLPSPPSILASGVRLITQADGLWIDAALSLWRTLAAFGLALIFGIPIGLAMGASARVYRAFSATIDFFRSIPPIALFPIFILTFGISESSRIAVPFYGAVLVMIVNTAYGVLDMPKIRRSVGEVFHLTPAQTFFHVILPSAIPHIVTGARISISLSLVLVIVVEMTLSAERGLGSLIYDYHTVFETPAMYFVIITVGILGYILNKLFETLERRYVAWKGV